MLDCTGITQQNFSGLTLAGHQVLTKPPYHSPSKQEMVGENKMDKILTDQDKGSSIKKGCAWKQMKTQDLFSTSY